MNRLAERPNILLFIKSLGLGGAERLLVDSLPYLDRTRFNYHVAYLIPWKAMLTPQIVAAGLPVTCLGDGGQATPEATTGQATTGQATGEPGGQSVKVTDAKSVQAALTLPLAYWRLHQLQQRVGFDLIHADMPVAGILARVVGRQQAIPVIYTEHNLIERYHPLTRWVHGATYSWQDCVLSVSEEVHASIRRSGGDQKTEVRTLLNGVPVDQVRNEATRLNELRSELEIPDHHTVVGAVAVFRAQKRLEDWLAVAALVAQKQSDVTFLLVGDGPEMGMVRTRIDELGLSGRIRLPGFRSDGRRFIGLMDLFLITSQFEGLPIAMLEAMALGKPVVATAVGGIPEVITNGHEGLLSPFGAISQLAQQVVSLIKDPELRNRMGQRAERKIEADYHIKFRVQAIEQLYTEIWQARQAKGGCLVGTGISKDAMKHLTQQFIKSSLLLAGALHSPKQEGYAFLIYHSVNGGLPIELDLAPEMLERQLDFLAQSGQIISYDSALQKLQSAECQSSNVIILTFDDGYLDFYTTVYPLLQRQQLSAILFVTTGFVEERVPYPMLSHPNLAVKPVTWEMLGEMAESGLVTLGAHTHTHPVFTEVDLDRIEEELVKPIELFKERLGITPQHFCYPRAIWRPDVEYLVSRYYQSAVIGGGKRASAGGFHPYRIPRLPIRRSDGWRFFRAKVEGRMANEEEFYSRMRPILRR